MHVAVGELTGKALVFGEFSGPAFFAFDGDGARVDEASYAAGLQGVVGDVAPLAGAEVEDPVPAQGHPQRLQGLVVDRFHG
jgi:hypothetical protein